MTQVNSEYPNSQPVRDRLPFRTKAIYGLGTALDMWGLWLYPAVAFAVFNIYLGVEPWLVGLALTIMRLYDAFADPIMGWLSDNFRSKYGRRRPFILVAGVISGLGLPLLFFVSPDWVAIKFLGVSVAFWYMILSTLIYIPIIAAFSVPYNSLGAEMSPDYEERTSITTFRSVTQKIMEVGNFYALKFTNLSFFLLPNGEGKNTLLGIQVYTAILGTLMAIFAIIMFLDAKERYYDKVVVKIKEKVSLRDSFYYTLKCRPFRNMVGMSGAFILGTSMVGSLGYYATVYYVCVGNTIAGDNWNFWMGITFMLGGIMGAPFMGKIANKTQKMNAVVVAAAIGLIGYGGSWFLYTPEIPWLQTLASGLMGFAAAGFWMLEGSIIADIVDYDELETAKRREGSFVACATYIKKLANSGGYFVSGLILGWAGFDANLGAQSAETIVWIRTSLAGIPVFGMLLAIFFALRIGLTRHKCTVIRRQLEERRGMV
jgi:GPH family glycoside/pentoside/hexuronide:cation symporter